MSSFNHNSSLTPSSFKRRGSVYNSVPISEIGEKLNAPKEAPSRPPSKVISVTLPPSAAGVKFIFTNANGNIIDGGSRIKSRKSRHSKRKSKKSKTSRKSRKSRK